MASDPDDLFGLLNEALTPDHEVIVPEVVLPDVTGWGIESLVDDPVEGLWFETGDSVKELDHARFLAAAEHGDPSENRYLLDPVFWAKDRLNVDLWTKQRSIIESVRDHERTAVHTCHTVGKSFCSACTVLWWIDVHPPGTAFVVTTAPTASQVRAILWREISRLHQKGHLSGRVNLTNEWLIGQELVAMGRKPPDYKEDAFQGIHARYVLVVFDEACGIPRWMWDAASTLVSNEESRFLAIGNPDNAHTAFGEACGAAPRISGPETGLEGASSIDGQVIGAWHTIHVAARDTPNFTGEPVSEHVAASLVAPRWVQDRAVVWGVNSAIYKSKVDGEFPADSDDGVIPYTWAVECKTLDLPEGEPVTAGLDVAGGGADRTVLRERRGTKAGRERVWAGDGDTVALATEIGYVLREWGVDVVTVDAIGVGHGMVSELRRTSTRHQATTLDRSALIHDAEVVAFKASEKPTKDQWLNARSELYWTFRELVRLRLVDLGTVDEDTLAELCAPTYEVVPASSKIKIESKSDLKKRLGASPDRAEALLLAFWERNLQVVLPVPAEVFAQSTKSPTLLTGTMVGPPPVHLTQEELVQLAEERAEEVAQLRALLDSRVLAP